MNRCKCALHCRPWSGSAQDLLFPTQAFLLGAGGHRVKAKILFYKAGMAGVKNWRRKMEFSLFSQKQNGIKRVEHVEQRNHTRQET